VKVKFIVSKATTQTTCLRLMRKKMLVALMMEGKFSGEGIHSLESDDDMMSAMARELVERGNVGESAAAVWADLKREREQQMPSMPTLSQRFDPVLGGPGGGNQGTQSRTARHHLYAAINPKSGNKENYISLTSKVRW